MFLEFTVVDEENITLLHNMPIVKRLLEYWELSDRKAASTPLKTELDLSLDENSAPCDSTTCKQLIA